MSEFYSPKAKPSQYSRPHFERPASVHQISTGYNGNNAFDYQDPTTKEKNRLRPPSQGSNDVTMKYWTTKEPDYLSEKELVPQTINIQPCNRPLIDKEEPYEGRPKQSQRQERTHSGRSHKSDKGFESGQQSGNRRHQSSNYGIRDQAEPKSAMSKIGENPKSIEKKIVFDLSSQTSHPTRDHISPDSVRYTKMSEDEAAHAFETRRKALIDNLLKRAEKAAEKPEGRMGEVHPHEIEKKKEENIKSPSSVSVKNKTNLRQAPVPMKSLGAELARAKQKSYAKNAQACSSKLKINEEATSIGSSAIVTPKSESVDFENTLPRKNNLIHKAMSPVRNSDVKIQKSPQRSSYASPELAKKKKSNEDENTVQLKNIFMKKPSIPDQQIYSKAVEEEKRYHADDEHAREQGFLNPVMANENKQRLNKEAYGREDTEHFGYRNIRNRAQTEAPNEKSKVQEESSLDNKNDIKSKFIRRKRKVSNEVDNQETRNEEDFFPTETEIIPYSSLNEKGFESHHQYLHERALLQKRNRDIAHQQSKQQNDQKEVQRCTFRPTIGSPPKLRENIIEKTKKWQISREQQIAQNKVDAMEKELVECTFYPNRTLANLDSNPRNFGDFLKRNAEWNQKRTEENKRKEEELFQKSHTSSIRSSHYKSPPRETPTTKRSCCHEKELALSKPVSVKNKHPNRGFKSPPKNQEIRACQHHEKENLHSHKPTERLTTVINDLDAIQETQQDLKTTLQMATQHFDDKIEDIPQVQDDVSQSYGILQNLKNVVSEREGIKKSKEEKRKVDIDLLLKTTGERFLRESGSLERIHQHESNRKSRRSWKNQRNSASPSKINDSLFKEVPVTSIEYDADIFQGNTYKVMLKKNKYYVSQRSELHSELKNIVEANSSPGLKVSDFLGEGDNVAKTKGILVQRKSRESSAKKTKTVTISPDDQNQRVSYFPTKEPEQRSFQYVTSEVMNNIEPQPTLHQRYADIINQASQIFTQLGQTSYQTYMSDWNA